MRVSRTEELQAHLHELLAGELTAGEPLQNRLAVLGVEGLALRDAADVVRFELEPPVGFEFRERHRLVVGPSEGSVGPGLCFRDVEFRVCFWQVHAAESSVVGEVAEGFHFFDGEAGGCVFVLVAFPVVVIEGHH